MTRANHQDILANLLLDHGETGGSDSGQASREGLHACGTRGDGPNEENGLDSSVRT